MLLIDDEGNKMGVVLTKEALDMAKERGLDLVEVAPGAKPPVARIMDYGKYLYSQQKRKRDAKKKQAAQQLKEIKLRVKTEEHDLQTKLKKAREFLEKGDRVKVHVRFRGREMAHPELGRQMLQKVIEKLEPLGRPMTEGEMQGRNLITVIAPYSKSELTQRQQKEKEEAEKEEKSA